MIPLTIREIKRLLAALTTRPLPRRLIIYRDAWTRRHKPDHDGSTNAPDSLASPNSPRSNCEVRLPYWANSTTGHFGESD
jgi:hypothetical protein